MNSFPVAPGISRLGTKLVNWYLGEEEGRPTAVDAGLPKLQRDLEANPRSLGFRLEGVEVVVLPTPTPTAQLVFSSRPTAPMSSPAFALRSSSSADSMQWRTWPSTTPSATFSIAA